MTAEGLLLDEGDAPAMPILSKYEGWLIGEEIQPDSRDQYLRTAGRVVRILPGRPPRDPDELKARVAALTKDELLVIKEKVGKTSMKGKKYAPNSASTSCTEINVLLKWAECPHRVKVPRRARTLRVPLTPDEQQRLLRGAGMHRHPELSARNRAVVALLLESALRSGSLNVLREDLRLDDPLPYVVVRDTKEGDDWRIPLAPVAVEALQNYFKERRKGRNKTEDRWTFITFQRNAMTDDVVRTIVKEAALAGGITRDVWPHLCRHTKLTDLARQGVNPWDIKDFACQRNMQSLEPYIHMGDPEQAARILAAPLLSGPSVRIEDIPSPAPASGSGDLLTRLTEQLVAGTISEATYNRALDNLAKKEAAQR